MTNMKRHIGKVTNTDQRCVVVWMQIPNRESHALVCSIDNLPPRIESALMTIVESQEGQGDPTLANVLNRRLMPDMGNKTVLTCLHEMGLLSAVPVDNITMMPVPNMPFPLRRILQDMGQIVPDAAPAPAANPAEVKFNAYGDAVQRDATDLEKGKAKLKILEAELLEGEAQKKREEAYAYDPSLRPQAMTLQSYQAAADVVETVQIVSKPRKPAAKKAAKKDTSA